MKRSRFLQILGLGAIAAPVAIPLAVKTVTGLAEMIKPDPKYHKITSEGILAGLKDMSNQPSGDFVMWTGKDGMERFDKAMREEMASLSKRHENEIMYGNRAHRRGMK